MEFTREGRLFRVVRFDPSHRQLLLRSEALAVDSTTTVVEVHIGHVELMLLKPIYRNGLHIRRASHAEFAELRERHGLGADAEEWTWMIERDGGSFVVGSQPAWRETEYPPADREWLFDFTKPWPPDYPAKWGILQ
ncbi:hypothetical protein ACIBO5_16570 [Nonomuraea angiospora]|uniref:hypothetical protein n=1 Tax=Nonomuraea angiospora TaxID=46172 RepID=UPI0029AF8EBA|nr:hypothetical protein [Nonomuraea angiospora]MDX3109853.1 hypothetical protein [Nonomuraea angiospora]